MEFNCKSNSPYSYMKYDGYMGQYTKNKEYYIVPKLENSFGIRNMYDIFGKIESALVDLLNMGRICMEPNVDEHTKFVCALMFVEQYGLLGFMVDAPENPNFLLSDEIILKDNNYVSKCKEIRPEKYFELFFPFATGNEMSYTVTKGQVVIKSNSDLQNMMKQTTINNQLIYSSFYCEKLDWIIDYAKDMYSIFKKFNDLLHNNLVGDDIDEARKVVNSYVCSGVPYKINIYGNNPEINWKPGCLKQALDMAFGFMICNDKNPIKICKHCGKVFYAKNPKAEYDTTQCRNQANVYKSRNKNKDEK